MFTPPWPWVLFLNENQCLPMSKLENSNNQNRVNNIPHTRQQSPDRILLSSFNLGRFKSSTLSHVLYGGGQPPSASLNMLSTAEVNIL